MFAALIYLFERGLIGFDLLLLLLVLGINAPIGLLGINAPNKDFLTKVVSF